MFKFEITYQGKASRARTGTLHTPHGSIQTPAFVFCATKADVKGVSIDQLKAANTQLILSNTYHLMLRPGSELIKEAGGLHRFMGWKGPILTDSGGFQIFSLGYGGVDSEIKGSRNMPQKRTMLSIGEDGAYFRAYTDGKKLLLTPELSIKIQREMGADLIVCLDECTPYHVNKLYTANAMEKSKRWALRCLLEFQKQDTGSQKILAVIQGGVYPDLRAESAHLANENDFFGFAIGGSLGKTPSQMYEIVHLTAELLDRSRPVHLLGIGGIEDIIQGVRHGIDSFDCVNPTRIARHGCALLKQKELHEHYNTDRKYLNLKSSVFQRDFDPISSHCDCYTCQNFSKAYIHYLLRAGEVLGGTLVALHNIRTMNKLMEDIRWGISHESLDRVHTEWCKF